MFGKWKKLTICGCDRDKLYDVQINLCNIVDSVGLTDEERDAMMKAVQIIARVSVSMDYKGKLEFD